MGKVIAICNQKGGCGKTTTAINLGTYLALEKKKSLLIDIDPQGNATSGVGIDKKNIQQSIYDSLLNNIDIRQLVTTTKVENFFIIPSSVHLTGAEIELVGAQRREARLKEAMSSIRNEFDYILIDSPPSLGLLTLNALTASDSALIPLQCEYYALEGLSQLINTINLVRQGLNSSLELEGILMTMADFRTNLTKEVIVEARSYFKEKVFQTVIPRSVRLSEAPSFGMPVYLYDPESQGAKMYSNLATELIMTNTKVQMTNE